MTSISRLGALGGPLPPLNLLEDSQNTTGIKAIIQALTIHRQFKNKKNENTATDLAIFLELALDKTFFTAELIPSYNIKRRRWKPLLGQFHSSSWWITVFINHQYLYLETKAIAPLMITFLVDARLSAKF